MLVKGDKMCYYRNMAIRPCSNTERGTLMENRKKLAQVTVEHNDYGGALERRVDDELEVFEQAASGKCERFKRTVENGLEVLTRIIKAPDKEDGKERHEIKTTKGEAGQVIITKRVYVTDPA